MITGAQGRKKIREEDKRDKDRGNELWWSNKLALKCMNVSLIMMFVSLDIRIHIQQGQISWYFEDNYKKIT